LAFFGGQLRAISPHVHDHAPIRNQMTPQASGVQRAGPIRRRSIYLTGAAEGEANHA
jgi:hypothetical protein